MFTISQSEFFENEMEEGPSVIPLCQEMSLGKYQDFLDFDFKPEISLSEKDNFSILPVDQDMAYLEAFENRRIIDEPLKLKTDIDDIKVEPLPTNHTESNFDFGFMANDAKEVEVAEKVEET